MATSKTMAAAQAMSKPQRIPIQPAPGRADGHRNRYSGQGFRRCFPGISATADRLSYLPAAPFAAGGANKGDSNTIDGEETGFTGEERAAAPGAVYREWPEPFSRK